MHNTHNPESGLEIFGYPDTLIPPKLNDGDYTYDITSDADLIKQSLESTPPLPSTMITLRSDGNVKTGTFRPQPTGEPTPLYVSPEYQSKLEADINGVREVSNRLRSMHDVAVSLEHLLDVVETTDPDASTLDRFEMLANKIASHSGLDKIVLSDSQHHISTEGLSEQVKQCWMTVDAKLNECIEKHCSLYQKLGPLQSSLRNDLIKAQGWLKRLAGEPSRNIIPSDGMQSLCQESCNFNLWSAVDTLRGFTETVNWVTLTLAPATIEQIRHVRRWISNFDTTNDSTVLRSFEQILTIPALPVNPQWRVDPDCKPGIVRRSPLYFTQHYYREFAAPADTPTALSWLQDVIYGTKVEFVQEIDVRKGISTKPFAFTGNTALQLLDKTKELVDLTDHYRGFTNALLQELTDLRHAASDLTSRVSVNPTLSEASIAKVVLAIQAPHYLIVNTQSPFRDVLYEAVQVVAGVVSLANTVHRVIFTPV